MSTFIRKRGSNAEICVLRFLPFLSFLSFLPFRRFLSFLLFPPFLRFRARGTLRGGP